MLISAMLLCHTLYSQTTAFKNYNPCSFNISLPASFQFSNMNETSTADYCDYEVVFKEKGINLEVHSLLSSRFETTDIDVLYNEEKSNKNITFTYQFKSEHFYVLSGQKDGKIFYRKRYFGSNNNAELDIEYLPSQKNLIEKYIGKISGSFKCD